MDFLSHARQREAVREYADTPIEREDILYALECARMAPSALNAQPWKFIVVDDPALRQKVSSAIYNPILRINRFVLDAPVITVVLRDISGLNLRTRAMVKKFNFTSYDIGMAVENFCLAAADRGVGSCVLGWFNQKKLRELLEIPDEKEICLVIAMGHPKFTGTREKERKSLSDIHSFNRYE